MKMLLIGTRGRQNQLFNSFGECAEFIGNGTTKEDVELAYATGKEVNGYCVDRLVTERDMAEVTQILIEIRDNVNQKIQKTINKEN